MFGILRRHHLACACDQFCVQQHDYCIPVPAGHLKQASTSHLLYLVVDTACHIAFQHYRNTQIVCSVESSGSRHNRW